MMHLAKLTVKYQATIPEPVREVLKLKKGDRVVFEMEGSSVHLRKATPLDLQFAKSLQSTLEEWNSPNDEEAYCDL